MRIYNPDSTPPARVVRSLGDVPSHSQSGRADNGCTLAILWQYAHVRVSRDPASKESS